MSGSISNTRWSNNAQRFRRDAPRGGASQEGSLRLEACLEELLADPDRMQAMGEHSRAIIEQEHNINTYMENLVAALQYGASPGGVQRDRG